MLYEVITLSIYLSTKAAAILGEYGVTAWFNILSLFPYLIVWMLFFVIYKISPNTNVDPKAALITSFIIAAVWTEEMPGSREIKRLMAMPA